MAEDHRSPQQLSDDQVRAQLAAIVDSSDDAIISKTLDCIVITWNGGAERLYGYRADEAVGRDISFIVPEERREELRQITERIASGERVENLETLRMTKEGRQVWVSLTLSPILDSQRRITGVSTIARDITERRQLEYCLKESEKRYRTLVEFAPDGVVVHQDGRFVYANCAALGIFGARSLEELRGTSLLELVYPEELPFVKQRLAELLQGEAFPLRELRLRNLYGQEISVEASSALIDYHGRPSIQIIARDITERKRIEQDRARMQKELAFERVRFETVVLQMPIGVAIVEAPSGRLLLYNEQARRIFGFDPGEVAGLDGYQKWQLFRDGSPLAVEEYPIVRSLKGETIIGDEYCFLRADGSLGCLSVNSCPIRDGAGELVAALAAFDDITVRKEAVKAQAASEQRLNLALNAAEMGSCDMELPSGTGVWSERHFLLLGYPPPEGTSGPATTAMWLDLVVDEDRAEVLRGLKRAKLDGSLFQSEHRLVRADDGVLIWVNVMGRFLCDEAGAICRFIGVICDVTERKKAEEALKTSEATLKLAIETTGVGIFDWDIRSGRHDWSEIAKSHYGLPPEEEMTHRVLLSAIYPEDRAHMERCIDEALLPANGLFSAEYRTVGLKDGKLRWLTSRGRVTFNEKGEPLRMVGACLDITEIVKAEKALKDEIAERLRAVEELRKQEQLLIRQGRLAAMGEMIGNIAHQWRQPLNTLGLIVQELPRMYQRGVFDQAYLDASTARAMQVINYMSKTIDGFRNFFGPDKEKESFRAAEVLSKTVSIVEAAFKELNLSIEVEAHPDLQVYGYPNEFSQVILNILVNAKDAILERRIEHPKVAVRLFRENGKTVLTICDNAGGIAPEIMERIFDPYFTTKGPDKGTGIGLFMSKTIIEKNMNGSLTARNTAEGAEFRIEV
ncbi:PAS domain S-box protein [Geomonas sp.]|uniref:PAS domain S-box protein n=1 Tax=Geomonas sp. TaxID=2651584 RepID=UPI002B47E16E|nr:PAS domain S-box protein [Geomonas sp.]HJV35749.1 PAS domain S-box protein [Geomonas sp.]